MESEKFLKTTAVEGFERMPDCLIKLGSFIFPYACTCECLAFVKIMPIKLAQPCVFLFVPSET